MDIVDKLNYPLAIEVRRVLWNELDKCISTDTKHAISFKTFNVVAFRINQIARTPLMGALYGYTTGNT